MFTWVPAQPGSYTLEVLARPEGMPIAYEVMTSDGPFTITAAPTISLASLTASVASPMGAGTTVTWTATASGGVGPLQYEFWVQHPVDGWWRIFRPYDDATTATWVAPQQGTFDFQVRVRSAGTTTVYEQLLNVTGIQVTTSAPSVPFFTADRPFPLAPNTTVTWTVQAGGTGPLEYEYWLNRTGAADWWKAQPYSSSPIFEWTPTVADTYTVSVRVRPVGSPAGWLAFRNVGNRVVASGPIASVGISSSQPLPVAAGTPITWTATATGGSGPLEYQFWRADATTAQWTMVRGYSADPTWTWTPAPTDFGEYVIQVWVRSVGSGVQYEAYALSGYIAVTP